MFINFMAAVGGKSLFFKICFISMLEGFVLYGQLNSRALGLKGFSGLFIRQLKLHITCIFSLNRAKIIRD